MLGSGSPTFALVSTDLLMPETTIFYEAPNILGITQSPLARLVEVQHIASTVFSTAIENSRIHILILFVSLPFLSFMVSEPSTPFLFGGL